MRTGLYLPAFLLAAGMSAGPAPAQESRALAAPAPVPPDPPPDVIVGAFGVELGRRVGEADLRAMGFSPQQDGWRFWHRSGRDGNVLVQLIEVDGPDDRRIAAVSRTTAIPGAEPRIAYDQCMRESAAETRRLMEEFPTLARWSRTHEDSSGPRTFDYLSPRRPRARHVEVECRSNAGTSSGGERRAIAFLRISYRDGGLWIDAARRDRVTQVDELDESSGAARFLLAIARLVRQLGPEEAARHAAENFAYDLAAALLANSVAECDQAAATDRSRRPACVELWLRWSRYSLLAGNLPAAKTRARRGLELQGELEDVDASARSDGVALLAEILLAQEFYREAEVEARRAITVLLDGEGAAAAASGNAHLILARTLWRRGRLDEAETHARRGVEQLSSQGSVSAETIRDYALGCSTIAEIIAIRGRWREADHWHRRALNSLHGAAVPASDRSLWPAAARIYAAYGETQMRIGRPELSERLFRLAVAFNRLISDNRTSRAVAESHYRLGASLAAQGKKAEAEAEFRRAVPETGSDPAEFAEFAPQRFALAEMWTRDNANPREAYRLFDQAIRAVLSRAIAGDEVGEPVEPALARNRSGFVGQVRAAWAAAHLLPPRTTEASAQSPEEVALFRDLANDSCREWTPFQSDLSDNLCLQYSLEASRSLLAAGNAVEAELHARRAAEVGDFLELDPDGAIPGDAAHYSPIYRVTSGFPRLSAAAQLAATIEAQGKAAEAEPHRRQVLQGWVRARGEIHADTAGALLALIANLARQGKRDEVEALVPRAVAGLLDLYGEAHPETASAFERLAALLRRQRSTGAAALARRAAAARTRLAALRGQARP